MINRRLPPSSALSRMTAWAVVAEPEKKSRTMSLLFLVVDVAIFIKCSIKASGLGNSKILLPNISMISCVPSCVIPMFSGSLVLTGM